MPLQLRETTTEQFPGLTKRYPVRLIERSVEHMQPRQLYRVRVCMFVGNPAFECVMKCADGFEGHLFVDRDLRRSFATAAEAIYLHVLEKIEP